MFKIEYEAENKSKQFAWQISYGLTTRTIGVMIMVHGDNKASCCLSVCACTVLFVQTGAECLPQVKGECHDSCGESCDAFHDSSLVVRH